MAEYAISGDVATLAGDDHTAGDPAALWVESSAPILVDSTTGRVGGRLRVTLEDDGTFEQTGLPETVGGVSPLYRLVVDTLSLRRAGHKRGITTGWFPLTEDRDLTWIIANYVEVTPITTELATQIAAAAALGDNNNTMTAGFITSAGDTQTAFDTRHASRLTTVDADAGSGFRVQQDARHTAKFGRTLRATGGDDTTALNTALAAVPTGETLTLYGEFTITGTVTVPCNLNAAAATLNYTGTGTALRVGTATSGAWIEGLTVICPKVINNSKTVTGWAQVAGSIGIDVSNVYASEIFVPLIRSFETGLRMYGKGKGNVHNTVTLGHLDNNKINQLCSADATGWSNQNIYIGGQLSHNSGEGSNVSGTRHIEMAVTANPVNTNTWIGTSIEGDTAAYHARIAGSYNVLINCRWEASPPRVYWADGATQNDIINGYNSQFLTETFDAGSGVANNVISPQRHTRVGSGGTSGVLVLENQSGDTNAADIIMSAGARTAGSDPADDFAVARGVTETRMKRPTDTHPRMSFDHVNGRVYFGPGNATPTTYLGSSNGFLVAASVATLGSAALPATPSGYLRVVVNGANVKIPYYPD